MVAKRNNNNKESAQTHGCYREACEILRLSSNSEEVELGSDSVIKSLPVSSRCISNMNEADFVGKAKVQRTY